MILALIALALVATACDDATTDDDPPEGPFAGSVPAPEFPTGLDWLNTGGEPLTLDGLRGKIVALHFWAPSCVICTHTRTGLERLASEFPGALEIIGIHVPRLPHETGREAARQAVIRHAIDHPTVHDPDLAVWRLWDGSALPTTTLVDPAGNLVGRYTGEGVYDALRPVVASLIEEFAGSVDRTQVQRPLEREARLPTVLSYPAGIAVDIAGAVAYVADTGNHRIVAAAIPSGDVVAVYGDGQARLWDGGAEDASFSSPRGLALSGDDATLYVADTGNHAIRAIDLESGLVSTIAGTGALGPLPPIGGVGPETAVRSPHDVAAHDGDVYVAMTGSHQIWRVDLDTGEAAPFAGSSDEGQTDGTSAGAEMSQPSGLAVDPTGRWLYVTDAGTNSVRRVDLEDAEVETVVAALDGSTATAQLQYPLGIAVSSGRVIVADAYDHRLAGVAPDGGSISTLWGGPAGWRDGIDPRFYQPEAVHATASTLVVADTLNHAIRLIDLETGSTSTLVLRGIEAFQPVAGEEDYRGTVVELPPTEVRAGEGTVVIDISLPPDHKVNEQAPSSVAWKLDGEVVDFPPGGDPSLTGVTFPVRYPVRFVPGEGTVTADIDLFWCANDAESLCFIEQLRLVAPLSAGESGSNEVILRHDISLPQVSS